MSASNAQPERPANLYEEFRGKPWSQGEKKTARRAFEKALGAELEQTMEQFKQKASRVQDSDDMWKLEGWLGARRREINNKYDNRYSQMTFVLGVLLSQGRINEEDLQGLREDKIEQIRLIASSKPGRR